MGRKGVAAASLNARFTPVCRIVPVARKGCCRDEAPPTPDRRRGYPDDYEAWFKLNAQAFATKQCFFGETRLIVAGEVRWITAESIPRDLPDGSTVWEGVLIDVTEQVLAKQAAQQASQALQEANAELQRLATTDRLTRVWNRTHLEETLVAELGRAERYQQPVSLLMIDVDHFKAINDTHGHLVGDEVLIELTRRLGGHLRAVDVLARWGGGEFMVLLPNCTAAEAQRVAEKLRLLVADQPFPTIGRVTVSFGLAQLQPPETLDNWLQRTDDALSAAKKGAAIGCAWRRCRWPDAFRPVAPTRSTRLMGPMRHDFVQALIDRARGLQRRTLAEGVEEASLARQFPFIARRGPGLSVRTTSGGGGPGAVAAGAGGVWPVSLITITWMENDDVFVGYGPFGFKVRDERVRVSFFFNDWTRSIRGIRIGNSYAEVTKVLGDPATTVKSKEGVVTAYGYDLKNLDAYFFTNFKAGKVWRVEVRLKWVRASQPSGARRRPRSAKPGIPERDQGRQYHQPEPQDAPPRRQVSTAIVRPPTRCQDHVIKATGTDQDPYGQGDLAGDPGDRGQ